MPNHARSKEAASVPKRGRLPATVLALGVTSLLTDASSEMIFPLLPLYLTQVLGAGPAFLGAVEGAADTVASVLKYLSGRWADHTRRRKPFVVVGYGLAGAVRPLVALAQAPWHVLAVRVTDRVGKGLRSSPRDALIADAAGPGDAGRAFGFHRAMDHAGAVVGPLVASALLAAGVPLRGVLALAAVPATLAFAVVLSVREPPAAPQPPSATLASAPVRSGLLRAYLAVLALVSLTAAGDAFLLLRARELGLAAAAIPTLWAALHVSKLVCSYLGGDLSDRVPRLALIAAGWVVRAGTFVGLARTSSPAVVWALFILYGAYHGLTEPSEKALVRDLVPADARGRAYGAYHFVVGATALPSGLLVGWAWRVLGGPGALTAGAAVSLLGAVALGPLAARVATNR